ncbi:MAG TPA: cytochrome D1 domain-containing protein [Pyrinomonadaceae bacterium]|jgi:YVTN family beta-propeller protein|nr:cytochrome D1 domain-containing protein [Pyrinomonadaceae bacterium]
MSKWRVCAYACVAFVAIFMLTGPRPTPVPPARAQAQQPAQAKAPPTLLVLNKAENTLALVDPSTMKVVARVATGEGPHEVVTSSDGRTAYVSNYGAEKPGNSLSVIDLAARKEIRRVDLGPLLRPHGLAERDGKIYFTAEVSRVVARYDPAADRVDFIAGTGQNVTHMLVMHPTRRVVYTANILSNTVSVLELDVPQQPGPPPRMTTVAVGPKPEGLDISPDGRELWVGHNDDGGVSVIDTETNKVRETFKAGGMPIRIKFTRDGKYVLISSPSTGELTVFDAATRKELKRFAVGEAAVGIAVSSDSRTAYVASMAAGRVTAVDLKSMAVAGSVETGRAPDGLAWVGE